MANTSLLSSGLKKPIVITVSKSEKAVLEVSDEGMGIALEDHERVFERYERAVSDSNYSGLGLGLYIAKEIVALQSGSDIFADLRAFVSRKLRDMASE